MDFLLRLITSNTPILVYKNKDSEFKNSTLHAAVVRYMYRTCTVLSEVIPENGVEVDHDAHKFTTVTVWVQPSSVSCCHSYKCMA